MCALDHLVVELGIDGTHIVELKEAVGGQGFVSGRMSKPLEAFFFGFKLDESFVSTIEEFLGAAHDLRLLKALLFQEVDDHDVGIIGRGSLLKASVRFAQHCSKALCKV